MPLDKAIDALDIGCSLKLLRGAEWAQLWLDRDTDSVVWAYGEGAVGNARSICPRSVLKTQIEAHLSKGWSLDTSFYA